MAHLVGKSELNLNFNFLLWVFLHGRLSSPCLLARMLEVDSETISITCLFI